MGKYLDNRLKFHTASRVAIETNQPLAGAMNVDGHVVTDKKVWTADASTFPLNSTPAMKTSTDVVATTNDLASVFTNGRTVGNGVTRAALHNGYVWRNAAYPAVELYDKVEMSPVQYSDGSESSGKAQAYEIKDAGNIRVTDWVPPTAVVDPATGSPVAGYSGIAEAYNGSWTILQQSSKGNYAWALANGTWEFVFLAGMLTFDPAYTPTGSAMGYSKVRWTGFKYVGSTLDSAMGAIKSGTFAIKPFGFQLSSMGTSGTGSALTYSIDVPGFVVQIMNDGTGISMGDIDYHSNGSSTITFVDLDASQLGENTGFTAYAFTRTDGTPVNILSKTTL